MLPLLDIRIFTLSQEWKTDVTKLRTPILTFSYSPSRDIWVNVIMKYK